MRISRAHRHIIQFANEMGYFPTPKHTKEIVHLLRFIGYSDPSFRPLDLMEIIATGPLDCAVDGVMGKGWNSSDFIKQQKRKFYSSSEGKAFAQGEIKPWDKANFASDRARELGYLFEEQEIYEAMAMARVRSWPGISEQEDNVLTDWAIRLFAQKQSKCAA